MENPAVGAYFFERYCPNCRRTTVFLVTMSKREHPWMIITTTCEKCKQGEGKAI